MQVPTNVQYVECSVVLIVLEPKERLQQQVKPHRKDCKIGALLV